MRLARYDVIERYGLCSAEFMPATEWLAYSEYDGELSDSDDPDNWIDYSDE